MLPAHYAASFKAGYKGARLNLSPLTNSLESVQKFSMPSSTFPKCRYTLNPEELKAAVKRPSLTVPFFATIAFHMVSHKTENSVMWKLVFFISFQFKWRTLSQPRILDGVK